MFRRKSQHAAPCPSVWEGTVARRDVAHFALGIVVTLAVILIFNAGACYLRDVAESAMPVLSRQDDFRKLIRRDRTFFWGLEPNLSDVEFSGTPDGVLTTYVVSTNELSLRNPPVGPKGGRFRILAIGDSTTFGQYVNDAETWPAQVQQILDPEARRVEVINAGLIGSSSLQGLCYLKAYGFDLEPDLVIVTYGFNDWACSEYSDRERVQIMTARPLKYLLIRTAKNRGFIARDNNAKQRSSPGEFLDHMAAIQRACAERGADVLFVIWPDRDDLQSAESSPGPYRALIREAARITDARCVDLLDAFRNTPEKIYFDLVHTNAFGCRVAAESIASALHEFLPALGESGPPRSPDGTQP